MIKFVYFDVGGVVITDLSANKKWDLMKRDLGITERTDSEFEEFYNACEKEICVGRDVDSLIPLMKEKFNLSVANDYSMLVDIVNRFEANPSLWPVITKIRKKYKVGLLTNMYPRMLVGIQRRKLLPIVEWDAIVDSSVEKLQKPNAGIFKLAEKKAGFKANEVLFVDNSRRNILAAKKFGWQTFLYDSADSDKSSQNLLELISTIG